METVLTKKKRYLLAEASYSCKSKTLSWFIVAGEISFTTTKSWVGSHALCCMINSENCITYVPNTTSSKQSIVSFLLLYIVWNTLNPSLSLSLSLLFLLLLLWILLAEKYLSDQITFGSNLRPWGGFARYIPNHTFKLIRYIFWNILDTLNCNTR